MSVSAGAAAASRNALDFDAEAVFALCVCAQSCVVPDTILPVGPVPQPPPGGPMAAPASLSSGPASASDLTLMPSDLACNSLMAPVPGAGCTTNEPVPGQKASNLDPAFEDARTRPLMVHSKAGFDAPRLQEDLELLRFFGNL